MSSSTQKLTHKLFQPTLRVVTSSSKQQQQEPLYYPVRRVYCIGRNYREHAIEMGGDPDREEPFFFHKPADAVVDCSSSDTTILDIPYPPATNNLHFEGELVVAMGHSNKIFGYAVGCDLTRRDLQAQAKAKARPWDTAKGFDFSAPVGAILPVSDTGLSDYSFLNDNSIILQTEVNNEVKQMAPLTDMVWSVTEMIDKLSSYYKLEAGDLIMTGTPAGVGCLKVGDVVCVKCGGDRLFPSCNFRIVL